MIPGLDFVQYGGYTERMPVPQYYTVALHRSRPEHPEHRVIIDLGSHDPSMVCAQCQTPGQATQHIAHVLVPLQYTPLRPQDDIDAAMAEAIVRGDATCLYPVHESCLESWCMQYLHMPLPRAQYIADRVQHRREVMRRAQYIEQFVQKTSHAYAAMEQARAVMQHRPADSRSVVLTLRDIFQGALSFYALFTIDRHLRHHDAHACACIDELYYVWRREDEVVQSNLHTLRTHTYSIYIHEQ